MDLNRYKIWTRFFIKNDNMKNKLLNDGGSWIRDLFIDLDSVDEVTIIEDIGTFMIDMLEATLGMIDVHDGHNRASDDVTPYMLHQVAFMEPRYFVEAVNGI